MVSLAEVPPEVANAEPQTEPEGNETLVAQQEQLVSGQRAAQLFPEGTEELPLPKGMKRMDTPDGVFHFNPKLISAEQIHRAVLTGQTNHILELGPVNKTEAMQRAQQGEQPAAVVERQPNGTEVRAAAGTQVTAPGQMQAMRPGMTPGNNMQVEDPQKTLMIRALQRG